MNDDIEQHFIEASRNSAIIANAVAAYRSGVMTDPEALKTACVMLAEVNTKLMAALLAARDKQPIVICVDGVSFEATAPQ
jgi:hypothetical protein